MQELAICIISHNHFFETQYFLQNLLFKTSHKYRLHILDNASSDMRVVEYLEQVCSDTKGYFHHAENEMNVGECLNHLLGSVYQDYCVFVPMNALINENWIIDIIAQYSILNNPGVLSIRNGSENLAFSPQLHNTLNGGESELKNVLTSEYYTVEGVMFFKKDLILTIGPFECEKLDGFEQKEFTLRAYLNGYTNHYISRQVYFKLPITDNVVFPLKTEENEKYYKKHIDKFIRKKHKANKICPE